MKHRLSYCVLVAFTTVLLALASITSASLMTPERGDMDRLATALAFGVSTDDICGEDGQPHDHDCPYCRLLSETPPIRPVETVSLLLPYDAWQQLADLNRRAQARTLHHAARAPPALA